MALSPVRTFSWFFYTSRFSLFLIFIYLFILAYFSSKSPLVFIALSSFFSLDPFPSLTSSSSLSRSWLEFPVKIKWSSGGPISRLYAKGTQPPPDFLRYRSIIQMKKQDWVLMWNWGWGRNGPQMGHQCSEEQGPLTSCVDCGSKSPNRSWKKVVWL